MLSVLVPGGSGQLGSALSALASDEVRIAAPSSAELDVTSAGSVIAAVGALAEEAAEAGSRPLVVNAAAYTAVDAAETDEHRAFRVNADGARVLAAACSSRRVPMIHVSTDYVFPGDSSRPYEPEDPLGPRSAYGRTKAAGEDAVLGSGALVWVVRTAWVYGSGGANFVETMRRLESERETVSVVDDQRGSPTSAADLAAALLDLGEAIIDGRAPQRRVLHCTNAGETTWYGFARAIFEELGADPERVKPCSTAEFPRPAPRPPYSVLSNEAWRQSGLEDLRPWRDALHEYLSA